MALAQEAPRSQVGASRLGAQEPVCDAGDSTLTVLAALALAWARAAAAQLGVLQRGVGRRRPHRLPHRRPRRQPAVGLVGRLLAVRQRHNFGQFMFGRYPVDERWRVDSDRHHLRRASGAAADPARALQAAQRHPVLRGVPVCRLLPAARRLFRPALCRDVAVGRPAGDAGALLCRHRRCRCRSASCWRSAGAPRCRSSS